MTMPVQPSHTHRGSPASPPSPSRRESLQLHTLHPVCPDNSLGHSPPCVPRACHFYPSVMVGNLCFINYYTYKNTSTKYHAYDLCHFHYRAGFFCPGQYYPVQLDIRCDIRNVWGNYVRRQTTWGCYHTRILNTIINRIIRSRSYTHYLLSNKKKLTHTEWGQLRNAVGAHLAN